MSLDNDQKDADISNEMQLQNHSSFFFHKNESLLWATSILSPSAMAYNNIASLDKLSCTVMWTLTIVKTDLDKFPGPRMVQTTWM